MMNDLTGIAIVLATLFTVWRYPSRCLMTGIIVSNALLTIVAGSDPIIWHSWVTFPAQSSPVLSCLTLLVGSLRIGALPTHHAWRVSILTLLVAFLMATRYPEAVFDEAQLRVWSSVFFQITIIGGIGQVLWVHMGLSGAWRYGLTLIAFPIGSLLHSFFAFYPTHGFWTVAVNSLYPTMLVSIIALTAIALWDWLEPTTKEQQRNRYRKSNTELAC